MKAYCLILNESASLALPNVTVSRLLMCSVGVTSLLMCSVGVTSYSGDVERERSPRGHSCVLSAVIASSVG